MYAKIGWRNQGPLLLKPLKQGVEDIDVLDFMHLSLFLELLFSYQRWLQPSRSRQEGSYPQGQAATWAHSPRTVPEQPAGSLVRTDMSRPIPEHESRGRDPWDAAQAWPDKPSWVYAVTETVPIWGTWYEDLQPYNEAAQLPARQC